MTNQKPTQEQQINHLKIRYADVSLANVALQEQLQKTTEALNECQELLARKQELEPDSTKE